MTYFAGLLAVVTFLVGFSMLGIIPRAREAIVQVSSAGRVIGDRALSDDEKETLIQRAALVLLRSFVSILFRSAICVAISAIPIFVLAYFGFTTVDQVIAFLSRWDVIVVSTCLILVYFYWAARKPDKSVESDYSSVDRALHKLAFSRPFVQLVASDIEDSIFGKELAKIAVPPPIFITSLPRAGTTILLSALSEIPGLASHRYRDMPFLMAPILWSRLSELSKKQAELKERAHGDGILIGYDSPEAFEEVLWHSFWPDKYSNHYIELWGERDSNGEATDFFRRHFQKIIFLRDGPVPGRYISKNNANIARLDLLPSMFPGARIVVPLRHPVEHAASLLRQHKNFLAQHAQDPFVKRYMSDIGHFEFGALHKPIRFPGTEDIESWGSPLEPDYWLAYWLAASRFIHARRDKVYIFPQEALADAQNAIVQLCKLLDVDPQDSDFSGHFREVQLLGDDAQYSPELLKSALEVYEELKVCGMDGLASASR